MAFSSVNVKFIGTGRRWKKFFKFPAEPAITARADGGNQVHRKGNLLKYLTFLNKQQVNFNYIEFFR